MEKGQFIQLQNWMRQWGFSAWNIQTGPFSAHRALFVLIFLQLFHFHTGSSFLLPHRTQYREKGTRITRKLAHP